MNTIVEFPCGPTYADIWKTLSKIDVSEHIEKKNGLAYLSWAWAWGVLMDHYPFATYEFPTPETHSDGTVTVFCTVRIGECERTMWLPVMNYKNQPIQQPNAFEFNTAKMRCLVKCLSLYGLGHYIYAGEDLPAGTEHTQADPRGDAREQADRKKVTRCQQAITKAVKEDDAKQVREVLEWLEPHQAEWIVVWDLLQKREREYCDLVWDEVVRERRKEEAA